MKKASAELLELARRALERAGARAVMAERAAQHLVQAEAQGLPTHGMSRVPFYCAMLKNGRADGAATPTMRSERGAVCLIDNRDALPYEACAWAIDEIVVRARRNGIGFAGITNSGHVGVLGVHLLAVARAGLVGFAFTNSPAAIPAWGGERIPEGWALDRDGKPTTDPKEAIERGSMFPIGGVKGAMLALMFELICSALTGAAIGPEADSFFAEQGNRPRVGQAFVAIDPGALAGRERYFERVETVVTAMLADPEVRLPGARRFAAGQRAAAEGLEVPDDLLKRIEALAAG
jgi:(2R)-3-sulfolactate dehydrogenase (NADP+)